VIIGGSQEGKSYLLSRLLSRRPGHGVVLSTKQAEGGPFIRPDAPARPSLAGQPGGYLSPAAVDQLLRDMRVVVLPPPPRSGIQWPSTCTCYDPPVFGHLRPVTCTSCRGTGRWLGTPFSERLAGPCKSCEGSGIMHGCRPRRL
jgi:hypothetical protein